MNKSKSGPQFVRFFGPVIESLKALGGSGRPSEVRELIAQNHHISDEERSEALEGGNLRFDNQVHWARFYLVKSGYVDSSKRGVWSLTEKGRKTDHLTYRDALRIFKQVHEQFHGTDTKTDDTAPMEEDTSPAPDTLTEEISYRVQLMDLLKSITPSGFERLCQRLLRESGFEQVYVTGRSGDGGIDGHGVLQLNPLVSFKVLFQCKRYAGSISASQVRDFRGAMMGRADKGIIITTGTFTPDAQKEALRDGVPPIELVNGDKLIDMFENLELGLIPRKTYDVDGRFFEEFQ
jgi:restriction system protein